VAATPLFSVRATERLTLGDAAIPALFVRPDASGPRPAVLMQHGYGADKSSMLPLAQLLARHGFIALLPDGWGHGERFPASGPSWMTELNADYFLTVLRHTVNEMHHGLDELAALPDVRPDALLTVGFSMGAVAALMLGVRDPRVAGVVAAAGSSAADLLDISIAGSTVAGPEARAWALEHDAATHLTNLAPRPLLLQHGRRDDMIPLANALRLYETAKPLYASHPDRLALMLYDHRHDVSDQQIADAVEWTTTHFAA
jgi:dienelactone hydrolase